MKRRAAEHKKIPSLPLTGHSGEIEAGPHPLSLSRQEKPFRWPSLSSQPEEELITVLQLFARALHAEIAPVLESIWSTAELLKDRRESGNLENHLILKKAHRLIKHDKIDTWETGAAFFAHMTQDLKQVFLSVDWTAAGSFKVLEACLNVQGPRIPVYSLFVHKEELKGRQTA